MEKFVVLLVEDGIMHQDLASIIIEPHAELLIADTVSDGFKYLENRSDISHVILDGYVPLVANKPARADDNTLALAKHISGGYPGIKMYSASSDDTMNYSLSLRGCIQANKQSAPRMVVADILARNSTK